MPILDLQRRMRQLGRIRTGNQVATRGGGTRPSKLETFRLTSPAKELIEAAAEAYKGEVKPWANPGGGAEWEVITKTDVLDIVVPPGQSFSQWYEMWTGGGCQRRCDGETNVLTMGPCECPDDPVERRELAQDGRACKPTSRLNVILPALPDLGTWLLESHGFYAAVELAGSADFLAMAMQAGRLVPARLRLEQREKKEPGQPTKRYAVPVIEFAQTRIADLLEAGGGLQLDAPQPVRVGAPGLPPAPALPATSSFRAPSAQDAPGAVDPSLQLPESGDTADEAGQADAGAGGAGSGDIAFDDQDDAAAEPAGLSTTAFMQLLGSTDGVTHAMVASTAKRLYPATSNLSALTDEDRGRLWDNIEAQLPATSGAGS